MPSVNAISDIPEAHSAKYKDSFAYITIADRLPIIVTKAIDSSCRSVKSLVSFGMVSEDNRIAAEQEMKDTIGELAKLRNELQTDKPFIELETKAVNSDVWNQCLSDYKTEFGCEPKWFSAEWLYAECYLYRRIRQAFELTQFIQTFDPFAESKEEALKSSIGAVEVLADLIESMVIDGDESIKSKFIQFSELSLWGNKCDLSLSAGKQVINSSNPIEDLAKFRDFIIDNQLENLWTHVKTCSASDSFQLSLVLDNSGYELFTDLCFIEFLDLSHLLGDKSVVKFYVKSMPWFVSDVMTKDFHWLLNYLAVDCNSRSPNVKKLANKWLKNLESGKWVIVDHPFWTFAQDFSHMRTMASDLYQSLSESQLILFKGDLNYRKLTGDLLWDLMVPFERALRGFLPTTLCTFRTIKADVVVGIENKEMLDMIKTFDANWRATGDYAVIQLAYKT